MRGQSNWVRAALSVALYIQPEDLHLQVAPEEAKRKKKESKKEEEEEENVFSKPLACS